MNIFFRCSLNFICKKDSKLPNFPTVVSVLGITFGVLSFLTVVTILDAFQMQMKSIISSVNPNLTIFSTMGISDVKFVENKIKNLMGKEIEKISPFIYQESILAHGNNTASVYIRAIPGIKSASADNLSQYIHPTSALIEFDEIQSKKTPAILGTELANELNAKIGDIVTLMIFQTHHDKPPSIRYEKLSVVGFISAGLSQYDKQYILMDLNDGRRLFGSPNWASGFEIKLKNPDQALKISNQYSQELPYSMVAWQEIDASLFRQITRDGGVIKFIVFIISIVGVFNILVTLGLTVIDRSKQISLLRSLGAQKKDIIRVFVTVGAIIGVCGAFLGTITAVLVLWCLSKISLGELNQFYYLNEIPVKFNIPLTLIVFISAIVLSALGALYPAWKASKIQPIIGLKQ